MGMTLSHPIISKLVRRAGSRDVRVGAAEMQGFRMDMEDAMSIHLRLSDKHPDKSFFGVFDGHGGAKASAFVEQELWKRVGELDDPTDPAQLETATRALDAAFRAAEPEDSEGHGTTVVWCVVTNPPADCPPAERRWKICTGNLGDSRALLLRADGSFQALTEDHKPQSPIESRRIVAAGGHTNMNRVDGELALSRAIGDFRYKLNAALPVEEQKVIPVPDVTHFEAGPGDVLLVFCDGIVEQLENEQVDEFARQEMKKEDGLEDPVRLVSRLMHYSLDAGSKDNHSGMMVQFGAEGLPADERFSFEGTTDYRPGPLRPYQNDKRFVEAYLADAERHGYRGAELIRRAEEAEREMPVQPEEAGAQQGGPQGGPPGGMSLASLLGGGAPGGDDDEDGAGGLSGMSMEQMMMLARAMGVQIVPAGEGEDGDEDDEDDQAQQAGAQIEEVNDDDDGAADSPMK